MPPARIRERKRTEKGTLKRLMRELFKQFPLQLIVSAICIAFNIFGNLCSSIFVNFISTTISASIQSGAPHLTPGSVNPFVGTYEVTAMGITLHTNVTKLLIAMGIIYGIGVFASWFWNRTMAIVTQKFMNNFRKAMFNHMQDLPIKYFDTHPHGDIMSLYTNDIDTIRQFISQALPSLLFHVFSAVHKSTAHL